MARNAQEFVSFLAEHFRPLEAMCRQHQRFSSDDEIVAFLRPFEDDDKNLSRLIHRMREVGVLVELAGDWTPPPFLIEFVQKLAERHALASPKVILGWIATLRSHVKALLSQIDSAHSVSGLFDTDAGRFVLREVADVFQAIVRTVQENCERIAAEVADYRTLEDRNLLQSRLKRLIHLYEDYLEPVIRIVDVRGDFYAATEEVSTCCARLLALGEQEMSAVAEEVRFIRREVIWLRRAVVRRAEEARRELAPLCEAAVRESRIAIGVNRLLEAVRNGQWRSLSLESSLKIVEEKDGSLCSDLAIERYLRQVQQAQLRKPPRVLVHSPQVLQIPITPEDLIEKLIESEAIDDLLEWILNSCEEIDFDSIMRLFHSVIELRPDHARSTGERLNYEHMGLRVNAARWTWKGQENANGTHVPIDAQPAHQAR